MEQTFSPIFAPFNTTTLIKPMNEEEAPLEDPRVRQTAMLCTKKPSFEIACISYVHDVQLFKTECYLRNQYGLKKLGDFTMSEGHRYPLVDIIHNITVLGTTRTIISCEHSLTTRTIISCEHSLWHCSANCVGTNTPSLHYLQSQLQELGQSEPASMTAPVSRSVHRMGHVFHLLLHTTLTNILPQSIVLPADL